MQCQFRFKNNNQCNNKTIGCLKYCHLKGHQDNMDLYDKVVKLFEKEFISTTLPLENLTIYDVKGDGACLYRCMALSLYDIPEPTINHESDFTDNLLDLINKNREFSDDIDEEVEREMAYLLQQIIREWIMENRKIFIKHIGCTLESYVKLCHDFDDINDYNSLYKIFAGDEDFIKVDTGKLYQSGRNKGKRITKKVYIDDRWGAAPELFAFANICNVNVSIYTLKRFDSRRCKVVKGSLRGITPRMKLTEEFQNTLTKSYSETYIKFLLTDRQAGHYCYIKYDK